MLDSERLNGFPPKIGGWRDKTIHCQHIEHSTRSSCQCNRQEKEIKDKFERKK